MKKTIIALITLSVIATSGGHAIDPSWILLHGEWHHVPQSINISKVYTKAYKTVTTVETFTLEDEVWLPVGTTKDIKFEYPEDSRIIPIKLNLPPGEPNIPIDSIPDWTEVELRKQETLE